MSTVSSSELTLSEAIARLRLIDDEMMRVALQDQIELVQFILRIIMGMPDLVVISMETQKDLLQLGQGRSLSLDILAVDSEGTQYNIEVQRSSGGAQPHRPRYHLSLMDSVYLRRGDDFDELPKTKVIFITEHDCIGSGELIERFVFRNEKGRELKTDQEIIYLNTAFKGDVKPGDEDRAALAHDFRCTNPAEMRLAPLADRIRFLKNTKEGRVAMSSVIEQYAKQAADAERKQAEQRDLDRACKLYATGKHDLSELAELFSLDPAVLSEACGLQPIYTDGR